jgi:hypothetical protein
MGHPRSRQQVGRVTKLFVFIGLRGNILNSPVTLILSALDAFAILNYGRLRETPQVSVQFVVSSFWSDNTVRMRGGELQPVFAWEGGVSCTHAQ